MRYIRPATALNQRAGRDRAPDGAVGAGPVERHADSVDSGVSVRSAR